MKIDFEKYSKEELQGLINESTSISELLRKMGYPDHGTPHVKLTKFLKESDYDTSTLVGRHIKRFDDTGIPKKWLSETLCKNSTGNSNSLRQRLIKYGVKQYKCENPDCGISDWHGEELQLELHHINGDHFDNRLENLVLLCPNCHSQTTNFRGKNSKNSLNEKLSNIAISEAKTALENLIEYEEKRKEEIQKNKEQYIPKVKKEKIIKYCKNCGKPIQGKGKMFCSVQCSTEYLRKHSKISINDIIEESKKCSSLLELAKKCNISFTGIKKRLQKEGKFDEVKKNLEKNKKDYTVLQFDLNGQFIREWENGIVAAKKLKINKSKIYACCNNQQKTAFGYIWKWKNI